MGKERLRTSALHEYIIPVRFSMKKKMDCCGYHTALIEIDKGIDQ